jgi:hypothetical protein
LHCFGNRLAALFGAEYQMNKILRIAMGHLRTAPPGLIILLPRTHRFTVG